MIGVTFAFMWFLVGIGVFLVMEIIYRGSDDK
jgi:hypothetical protein